VQKLATARPTPRQTPRQCTQRSPSVTWCMFPVRKSLPRRVHACRAYRGLANVGPLLMSIFLCSGCLQDSTSGAAITPYIVAKCRRIARGVRCVAGLRRHTFYASHGTCYAAQTSRLEHQYHQCHDHGR
jgi:hypothetical protein